MKTKLIILSFIMAPLLGLSQGSQDVLRYSRLQVGGSARYMALGGAFGALGADFTTASVNPAGIAFFKTSEALISPAVHTQATESFYNGYNARDSRTNFYLGNVGVVITSPTSRNARYSGWKNFHFATGINRLKDFNNQMIVNGPNTENSLLHAYRDAAQGPPQIPYTEIEDDPFYRYADDLNLAWWTFLLDITGDSTNYDYITPVPYAGVLQKQYVETLGSMNEYVLTGGANYNDRLYLGLTLGIPYLKYIRKTTYIEQDATDTINDFSQFIQESYLETRGSGINVKFGIIYRATDWLRFGLAVHTPTWFTRLKDKWWTTLSSEFDNGDRYYEASPEGNYEYNMNTPFRAIGSVAFIFGEKGLFSLDYEYADYSQGKLKSNTSSHEDANMAIKNSYTMAHHIRAGTEWRYNNFSFRGGFSYAGSPYQNNINDGQATSYSAGIGYRQLPVYIDFAFVHQRIKKDYYIYYEPTVQANPSENLYLNNQYVLSVGYRF